MICICGAQIAAGMSFVGADASAFVAITFTDLVEAPIATPVESVTLFRQYLWDLCQLSQKSTLLLVTNMQEFQNFI
jgi:hypothetical protein